MKRDCSPRVATNLRWGLEVEQRRRAVGGHSLRLVHAPLPPPNCNAYAERFVGSVKEECLNRIVPLGERHLRRTLHQFAAHYQPRANHQGLTNELIERSAERAATGVVRHRQRVGGILNFYDRSAV